MYAGASIIPYKYVHSIFIIRIKQNSALTLQLPHTFLQRANIYTCAHRRETKPVGVVTLA